MTKADIGQLLSDQMFQFAPLGSRKLPMIEPDAFDDAEGMGFEPLDRWGDRKFSLRPHSWRD